MPPLRDPSLRPRNFITAFLAENPNSSTAECHRAYKAYIKTINELRPKREHFRGMTYPSMYRTFRRLEAQKVIRRTGQKPVERAPDQLLHLDEKNAEPAYQVTYVVG